METAITPGRIIRVPIQVHGSLAVSDLELDPRKRLLSITRP